MDMKELNFELYLLREIIKRQQLKAYYTAYADVIRYISKLDRVNAYTLDKVQPFIDKELQRDLDDTTRRDYNEILRVLKLIKTT